MLAIDQQLLWEQDIFPTEEVLKQALGKSFTAYEDFVTSLTNDGLTLEWSYYKDGKSWLCKVCQKKKTVLWLSVWNQFFKTTFFFTEKNSEDIVVLPIAEQIKDDFAASKRIGRLIPLIISITRQEQLKDVLAIVEYKKNLK